VEEAAGAEGEVAACGRDRRFQLEARVEDLAVGSRAARDQGRLLGLEVSDVDLFEVAEGELVRVIVGPAVAVLVDEIAGEGGEGDIAAVGRDRGRA
jgi:hypothetical protein